MERSSRMNETAERADFLSGYDLERQLKIAERRYAEARASCDKARQELRTLSAQPGVNARTVEVARAKFDTIAERCGRLRAHIDTLEAKLDV